MTRSQNQHADAAYDALIAAAPKIRQSMHSIEAAAGGKLVGLQFYIKSRDRFKEKLAKNIADNPGKSVMEHAAAIHDGVRFTLTFPTSEYSRKVNGTLARLQEKGFQKDAVKPSWDSAVYKGVNSRWRDGENGLLFELQFHTPESFEAKQQTHDAYERMEHPLAQKAEISRLKQFCAHVTASIPVPPGWEKIAAYRRKVN